MLFIILSDSLSNFIGEEISFISFFLMRLLFKLELLELDIPRLFND